MNMIFDYIYKVAIESLSAASRRYLYQSDVRQLKATKEKLNKN